MIIDFHSHTFLSDGVLSPAELVQRAVAAGYRALAITDHVGYANYQYVCEALLRECEVVNRELPITALVGVEITHVAPRALGALAERCKAAGAQVVAVHGETITEPVPAGTNAAAAECEAVDVLAHPGLLTAADARVGQERGLAFELSARKGHSAANGRVARVCQEVGATMIVNSDSHAPEDLLTESLVEKIILGAGLERAQIETIRHENTTALLNRCASAAG
ncbi:MAG: histidinol phosphate phosphatase domain-containing protein [Chloroflexota bacterium]|nr:histidinol phosphate phosphatase domain-containing protein [Chloroflexota bacterium]MDE2931176.1 histidinol phosphate phosphatase domain-containing protein [Chloroflexota bacterium]